MPRASGHVPRDPEPRLPALHVGDPLARVVGQRGPVEPDAGLDRQPGVDPPRVLEVDAEALAGGGNRVPDRRLGLLDGQVVVEGAVAVEVQRLPGRARGRHLVVEVGAARVVVDAVEPEPAVLEAALELVAAGEVVDEPGEVGAVLLARPIVVPVVDVVPVPQVGVLVDVARDGARTVGRECAYVLAQIAHLDVQQQGFRQHRAELDMPDLAALLLGCPAPRPCCTGRS